MGQTTMGALVATLADAQRAQIAALAQETAARCWDCLAPIIPSQRWSERYAWYEQTRAALALAQGQLAKPMAT